MIKAFLFKEGDQAVTYLAKGERVLIDADTFHLISPFRWYALYTDDGQAYAAAMTSNFGGKRKVLLMHRVIMNHPAGMQVDHVDGNGFNNQKSNLRIVTNKQNGENRKGSQYDSQTQVRGVYFWNSNGHPYWCAQVVSDGKRVIKYFPHTEAGFKQACDKVVEMRKEYFTHSTN